MDDVRGAPRHLWPPLPRFARGALMALCLLQPGVVRGEITGATYEVPTDRYGHGAVDGGEYAAMEVRVAPDRVIGVGLPVDRVFEDTAPRLVDLDGDGTPEIIAVVAYADRGAALRIYDEKLTPDGPLPSAIVLVAETAPIGRRHRWLAVAGAGDLDGDGRIEIAYVDRPHLAKILRILEIGPNWALTEQWAAPGFTNHPYGSPTIDGGVMDCGAGPEVVLADGPRRRVVGVTVTGDGPVVRDIRAYGGPESMSC